MISFLLKRVLLGLLTLFVVISVTFLMMRLMPGGPFDKERKLPPAIEKNLLAKYKLDGSPWEQYRDYIMDVVRGDLRLSTKYRNRTVNEIIVQTLPVSMTLGAMAFVLALVIGISLGSTAAVRHRTWTDHVMMLTAILSISIPNFVLAPLAVLWLSMQWHLFPVAGWGDFRHLILPAIFLALPYSAYIARLTRNSMLDVLSQDFLRTARAKGLAESTVILKHALKIALLPVLSYCGPLAANILTGSLVIERIFKIPGIGEFFVNGVLNRDLFVVGGTVILYSSLLIVFNILVDTIYTFLDRRIRLS